MPRVGKLQRNNRSNKRVSKCGERYKNSRWDIYRYFYHRNVRRKLCCDWHHKLNSVFKSGANGIIGNWQRCCANSH